MRLIRMPNDNRKKAPLLHRRVEKRGLNWLWSNSGCAPLAQRRKLDLTLARMAAPRPFTRRKSSSEE